MGQLLVYYDHQEITGKVMERTMQPKGQTFQEMRGSDWEDGR